MKNKKLIKNSDGAERKNNLIKKEYKCFINN